jgi:hypothetical protein
LGTTPTDALPYPEDTDTTDVAGDIQALAEGVDGKFLTRALFDANTIIAANADDTPAAVAVGSNALVGRAGGNIAALSVAASEIVGRSAGGNLGGLPWSSIRTILGITTVLKNSTENVTSSTVYQNDDQLLFAVGANEYWIAEFILLVQGATAGDIKFQLTGPAGSTVTVAGFGPDPTATAFSAFPVVNYTEQGTASAALGGFGTVTAAGTTGQMVIVRAGIFTSATAGTVNLQWAQLTSSGTASSVRSGSSLVALRAA